MMRGEFKDEDEDDKDVNGTAVYVSNRNPGVCLSGEDTQARYDHLSSLWIDTG